MYALGGCGCRTIPLQPYHLSLQQLHVLLNYGLGYRWEFKKNVNVRLDYGLGKAGQSGFIFNINEAF